MNLSASGSWSPIRLAAPWGQGLTWRGGASLEKMLVQEGRRQGGGLILSKDYGSSFPGSWRRGNSPEDCVKARRSESGTSLPELPYWLRLLLAG